MWIRDTGVLQPSPLKQILILRFEKEKGSKRTANSHTFPHYDNSKSGWREQRKSSRASCTSMPSTPGSQKEHPGGKKKTLEPMGMPWKPPTNLHELTISSLDPTGDVNLLLNVKVISS
jgi:hypothetical protein